MNRHFVSSTEALQSDSEDPTSSMQDHAMLLAPFTNFLAPSTNAGSSSSPGSGLRGPLGISGLSTPGLQDTNAFSNFLNSTMAFGGQGLGSTSAGSVAAAANSSDAMFTNLPWETDEKIPFSNPLLNLPQNYSGIAPAPDQVFPHPIRTDDDIQPQQSKPKATDPFPRTVDIFRSALAQVTADVVSTLKHHQYLRSSVSPKSSLLNMTYAKSCIQSAVELWILCFGMHMFQINREQFLQAIIRVQQLDDERYKYRLSSEDAAKLFWLTGADDHETSADHRSGNSDSESRTSTSNKEKAAVTELRGHLSLPEFALIFLWMGPPNAPYPITAVEAIRRAYTFVQADKTRRMFYEGVCSAASAETRIQRSQQPLVVRLVEGRVECISPKTTTRSRSPTMSGLHHSRTSGFGTSTCSIRKQYFIRNVVVTDSRLMHELVFNDPAHPYPVSATSDED